MEDFRMYTSWRRHRKYRRLRRELGGDGVLAIEALWAYAADMRPDGDLSGMSADDLADEAGWPGDPARLMAVLTSSEVRLVDGEPGSWRIHDWAEHQPYVVNHGKRVTKARRAAEARWADYQNPNESNGQCSEHPAGMPQGCPADATSMPIACSEHARSNAPTDRTVPTETKTVRTAELPKKEQAEEAGGRGDEQASARDGMSADELIAEVKRWGWRIQDTAEGKARACEPFDRDRVMRARDACKNAGGVMTLGFLLAKYARALPAGAASPKASGAGPPPTRRHETWKGDGDEKPYQSDHRAGLSQVAETLAEAGVG